MKSLRYRDVDPESIRGLKQIFLNHNPCIKDEGISLIADVLKEDAWIKGDYDSVGRVNLL